MNKHKGANAERELYHMLDGKGFACVRVAGSGMMENTACDLLVGKKNQKYAIECKATKDSKKYFSAEQIKQLKEFSRIFGVNPLVAIKFARNGWHFIHPSKLVRTGKGHVISLNDIKKKGVII